MPGPTYIRLPNNGPFVEGDVDGDVLVWRAAIGQWVPTQQIQRPQAFSPVFQTTTPAGAIGDGTFTGAFTVTGKRLRIDYGLWVGSTTNLDAANDVLMSFPPGFSVASLDLTAIPPASFGTPGLACPCARQNGTTYVVTPDTFILYFYAGVAYWTAPFGSMGTGDQLLCTVDVPLL